MIKTLITVSAILCTFISCDIVVANHDPIISESEPQAQGYYVYDNIKHDLYGMHLDGYKHIAPTPSYYEITFSSDTIPSSGLHNFTGDQFYFKLYSTNDTYLDSGTYTFVKNYETPDTFDVRSAGFRLILPDQNSYRYYSFTSATVHVKLNTDESYTIDFEGYLENYKKIIGHYNGIFYSF